MDEIHNGLNILDSIVEKSVKADNLPLAVLRHITGKFSDEQIIGRGGFGVVYKGTLRNGHNVAVKKLNYYSYTIDDQQFEQEVQSMLMVQHQNIVRLLGYCYHIEKKAWDDKRSFVFVEERQRLLCSEYVSNGTLESHLNDELRGLEWHTRYQIIKGICEGLHHLHNVNKIIHMDLKPANILLDDHMVPKITDFGISRLAEKSGIMGERSYSRPYCAPEYIDNGIMSFKSDIYSLGFIIVDLVTGRKEDPDVTQVVRRWKHRWSKSVIETPFPHNQVLKCLELAQKCKQMDPQDRPNIWDIMVALSEIDSASHPSNSTGSTEQMISCLEDMLGVEPLELHFPFELNKQISCSILLTNDTNDFMAFRITTGNALQYCIHPRKEVVPPRSTCSVNITLQAQEEALQLKHYKDELCVQSTRVDEGLSANSITADVFNKETGNVDKVNLTVVLDIPDMNEVKSLSANNPSAEASSKISVLQPPSKELLQVNPTVLRYPAEKNKPLSSSLQLANYTNDYIAFMFSTFSGAKYSSSRSKGIMPPWSTWGIVLNMEASEEAFKDIRQSKDTVLVRSAVVSKDLKPEDVSVAVFEKQTESHNVELDVVFEGSPQPQLPTPVSALICDEEEEAEKEVNNKLQLNATAKGPALGDVTTQSPQAIWLGPVDKPFVQVYPLELRFPFEPNKPICCPISLINKTEGEVYFTIIPTNPDRYACPETFKGTVQPRSTCAVTVTMKKQPHPPTNMGQFRILLGTSWVIRDLVTSTRDEEFRKVTEKGGKAHEVSLMAVICYPDPASETMSNETIDVAEEMEEHYDCGDVKSMDVHPTEPWVLTAHEDKYVCIWKSDPQAISSKKMLHITCDYTIWWASFVASMQWIITSDYMGNIRVYTYNGKLGQVKIIESHKGCLVNLVAVHPTLSYVLLSSENHIKLWSWDKDISKDWKCIRDFKRQPSPFRQIFFSPQDDDATTFVTFSSPFSRRSPHTLQIWRIKSDSPTHSFQLDRCYCVSNYFAGCDQNYMAIGKNGCATILHPQSNEDVHSLKVLENISTHSSIDVVQFHPTLDVLVTGTGKGGVFIWNSTTYWLMQSFLFEHGAVKYLGFVDVLGNKRLVIGFENVIEIVAINFTR